MTTQKNKIEDVEPEEKFIKPFHFENEREEIFGIETAIYPNNNQIKRVTLSNGSVAVVRELLGRDMVQIEKSLSGENNEALREEKLKSAVYHYSVKIDGKQIPMEDFELLKMRDYMRIKIMAETLNFQ
jgi:hypothetical protein